MLGTGAQSEAASQEMQEARAHATSFWHRCSNDVRMARGAAATSWDSAGGKESPEFCRFQREVPCLGNSGRGADEAFRDDLIGVVVMICTWFRDHRLFRPVSRVLCTRSPASRKECMRACWHHDACLRVRTRGGDKLSVVLMRRMEPWK